MKAGLSVPRLLLLVIACGLAASSQAVAQPQCRATSQSVGDSIETILKDDTESQPTLASAYVESLSTWQTYANKRVAERAKTVDPTYLDVTFPTEMRPDNNDSTTGVARNAYDDIGILAETLRALKAHPSKDSRKPEQLKSIAEKYKLNTARPYYKALESAYLSDTGSGEALVANTRALIAEYQKWLAKGIRDLDQDAARIRNVYISPTEDSFKAKYGPSHLTGDKWKVVNELEDLERKASRATRSVSIALTGLDARLVRLSGVLKGCGADDPLLNQLAGLTQNRDAVEQRAKQRALGAQ